MRQLDTIGPGRSSRRPARILGGAALAGALMMAACGGSDSDAASAQAPATTAPATTAAPTTAAPTTEEPTTTTEPETTTTTEGVQESAFIEDFDDPSNVEEWPVGRNPEGAGSAFLKGGYGIQALDTTVFATPRSIIDYEAASVVIVVDVVESSAGNPVAGVGCNVQRSSTGVSAFYFLGVSRDGVAIIGKRFSDGSEEVLQRYDIAGFDPDTSNNLIALCSPGSGGNDLTLSVNGDEVGTYTDSDDPIPPGGIGLSVLGNDDGATNTALFDNLEVNDFR